MTFEELLQQMTPELCQTMQTSIETGVWPDGRRLTQEESETAIQVVMVYQAQQTSPDTNELFQIRSDASVLLGKNRHLSPHDQTSHVSQVATTTQQTQEKQLPTDDTTDRDTTDTDIHLIDMDMIDINANDTLK